MKDSDIIQWFSALPKYRQEKILGQEEYNVLISKIRNSLKAEKKLYKEELSKSKQAEAQRRRSKKMRFVQFNRTFTFFSPEQCSLSMKSAC